MKVKENPYDLVYDLEKVREKLNCIIDEYLEKFADYGWDSFTEDLANVSAQIYKDEIMLKNAEVEE